MIGPTAVIGIESVTGHEHVKAYGRYEDNLPMERATTLGPSTAVSEPARSFPKW